MNAGFLKKNWDLAVVAIVGIGTSAAALTGHLDAAAIGFIATNVVGGLISLKNLYDYTQSPQSKAPLLSQLINTAIVVATIEITASQVVDTPNIPNPPVREVK